MFLGYHLFDKLCYFMTAAQQALDTVYFGTPIPALEVASVVELTMPMGVTTCTV